MRVEKLSEGAPASLLPAAVTTAFRACTSSPAASSCCCSACRNGRSEVGTGMVGNQRQGSEAASLSTADRARGHCIARINECGMAAFRTSAMALCAICCGSAQPPRCVHQKSCTGASGRATA